MDHDLGDDERGTGEFTLQSLGGPLEAVALAALQLQSLGQSVFGSAQSPI
ncbi:MAG: hypothetical protein U0930_10650 [Pirellulales bacterium]